MACCQLGSQAPSVAPSVAGLPLYGRFPAGVQGELSQVPMHMPMRWAGSLSSWGARGGSVSSLVDDYALRSTRMLIDRSEIVVVVVVLLAVPSDCWSAGGAQQSSYAYA